VVWDSIEVWLLKLISLVIRMKLLLPTIFLKDKWKISVNNKKNELRIKFFVGGDGQGSQSGHGGEDYDDDNLFSS